MKKKKIKIFTVFDKDDDVNSQFSVSALLQHLIQLQLPVDPTAKQPHSVDQLLRLATVYNLLIGNQLV